MFGFRSREGVDEFIENESIASFEKLPYPDEWPRIIDTEAQVAKVLNMFEESEELTVETQLEVKHRFKKGHLSRTISNSGRYITESLRKGWPVPLEDVPLCDIHTRGSSGSEKRQHYINAVIRKFGVSATFDRLPPILLARKNDGTLSTLDGATRSMVAYEQGLPTIKAYVIPEGVVN